MCYQLATLYAILAPLSLLRFYSLLNDISPRNLCWLKHTSILKQDPATVFAIIYQVTFTSPTGTYWTSGLQFEALDTCQ